LQKISKIGGYVVGKSNYNFWNFRPVRVEKIDGGQVIKQIELSVANRFVFEHHRHHKPAQGHKFSIGLFDDDGLLHGVAIVGHPNGRYLQDGNTLEVTRLCTDGTYNACSMLYSRCARIAKDFGYRKIITFILASETGASLKASGWVQENDLCGGYDWKNNNRYKERHRYEQMTMFKPKEPPKERKQLWVKYLEDK
jgi:hypothetical protein